MDGGLVDLGEKLLGEGRGAVDLPRDVDEHVARGEAGGAEERDLQVGDVRAHPAAPPRRLRRRAVLGHERIDHVAARPVPHALGGLAGRGALRNDGSGEGDNVRVVAVADPARQQERRQVQAICARQGERRKRESGEERGPVEWREESAARVDVLLVGPSESPIPPRRAPRIPAAACGSASPTITSPMTGSL